MRLALSWLYLMESMIDELMWLKNCVEETAELNVDVNG